MASTKVEVRDNRELRRVEAVNEDGEVAGFADYQISVEGDSFDFTRAEVDERFEGQGVGSRLAAGVLDFVRGENATIVPTCSFIRSYMEENEDTHDLLAEGASLGDEDDQDGKADQADAEDESTDDTDDKETQS